jgi:hypothetical protein
VNIWLGYLDVWGILQPYRSSLLQDTTLLPGLVTLLVWGAAVVVAVRLRHRELLLLHLVVAAALLSGFVTITRILGLTWFWLLLWGWGTTTLLVIATVWTAAVAFRPAWVTPRWGLAAVVAAAALLTYDATGAQLPDSYMRDSTRLAQIAPDTVRALRAGDIPGTGPDGRYLVEIDNDPFGIGASGQGLVLELERQGLDVGVSTFHARDLTTHRVRTADEPTAIVHLVVGEAAIAQMRARDDLTEVAFDDPRTPDVHRDYERDRAALAEDLREIGRAEVDDTLDSVLMVSVLDETLPVELRRQIGKLLAYPQPAAVFVASVS